MTASQGIEIDRLAQRKGLIDRQGFVGMTGQFVGRRSNAAKCREQDHRNGIAAGNTGKNWRLAHRHRQRDSHFLLCVASLASKPA